MTPPSRRRLLAAAALGLAAGLGLSALPAHAQPFPQRPITIVVGYTAGGANDVLARLYAEKLGAELGQPVIVENRPGVASIVGAQFVARAKPDGHTLLMGASGPMVFNHALYRKLPYKPGDLQPVSLVANYPLVLLTQQANPAKNVAELVEQSKRQPDKSNYGASTTSFQLTAELFKERTGATFAHIPYKGAQDVITALLSGDINMAMVDTGPASTGLQSGRIKALAVTSVERVKSMPQVPTLKELGIDVSATLWSGLFVPAGTPPEVVERLNRAVVKVGELPDVKARIAGMAIEPATSTPQALNERIGSEIAFWSQVAREKNIYAD